MQKLLLPTNSERHARIDTRRGKVRDMFLVKATIYRLAVKVAPNTACVWSRSRDILAGFGELLSFAHTKHKMASVIGLPLFFNSLRWLCVGDTCNLNMPVQRDPETNLEASAGIQQLPVWTTEAIEKGIVDDDCQIS